MPTSSIAHMLRNRSMQKRTKKSGGKSNSPKSRRRARLESLEERRLLALLGVTPDLPVLAANNTGTVSYNATTNDFVATADPLTFKNDTNPFLPGIPIQSPRDYLLQISVDESGNLIGGVAGDDFVVSGSIDLDGDSTPDVTGVLLTGEAVAFGFQDTGSGSTTDIFDLRLTVTGGALAVSGPLSGGGTYPAYFGGKDIGLRINTENSTFTGDFNVDFGGGNKSTFGPIAAQLIPAELGNYVWVDTNNNGLQDDGNTGVNGVTVELYVDLDGDGIAEPGGDDGAPILTTVTADDGGGNPGYYLFPDLIPDDYFVVFDPLTLPSGFEFTTQDAGADDIDSDADPTTGIAIVTTLDPGESDLTWDAGIVQSIAPAIEVIKYVDKIITTSEMTTIDFDDLTSGDFVSTQYPGVTINAVNNRTGAQNAAMVFDSANPTGGDLDLGTPNQQYNNGPGVGSGGATNDTPLGNVLIISEDGDTTDPDDEAHGGVFTFTFDDPVTINHIDLLDIDYNEPGGSVVTLTTPSGQQTFSIPTLGNNSYQHLAIDVDNVTQMEVNFVSSGAITELKYTTTTEEKQWFDANTTAVEFDLGEEVEFSYHVINTGDVPLTIDSLVDDNATPLLPGDDFNPIPVESGGFNVGDTNQNGLLDPADGTNPSEEWIFTFTITPTVPGEYCNIATVVGSHTSGQTVTDTDPAKYNILGTPDIDIEKLTNGVQADDASDAVEIAPGDDVTWTYIVTNTGGTDFAFNDVIVVDDNGTPGNTADDFTPTFVGPDVITPGVLSPGEVWEYTFTEPAQVLTSSGATSVFDFDGSSSVNGASGNIRSFTVDGVSVNASAFSRSSGGVWSEAFLGQFSGGLGVTDGSEDGSNGTHRVDNIGQDNFVLFEFSENVVVDQALLQSVVNDSDLSVWIGTIPDAFNTHQTLSDGLLSGLTSETNDTTSSTSRWANFNGGEISGNVLVLAASTEDTTPEDQFKIRKVKFQQITTGIYGNIATVNADGAHDSDPSHYKNPAQEPPGIPNIDIEKLTNGVDADKAADAVEIAPGSPVTWTYLVTNTGETEFAFADVVVMDDNGTPNDPGDDFAPDFVGPDTVTPGFLSPGETWEYSFSTTADSLTSTGGTSTFFFDGNSGLDGSNGNIRSYTVDGVSVNASAFSRDGNGNWAEAFLGSFSGGLGVTDSSEGDGSNGTHRVDNIGRQNYVLFEFSENVVVDQAFLDSVVGDSDLSVWIGTVPGAFGNHQTLSDALLNGLTNEVNNTTSSSARWANFNGGEVVGNVLVLAASTVDATPEDRFKIRKVKFQHLTDGIYANIGKVDAGDVWDSDPSHYKNPVQQPSAQIGNFVWNDADRDGKQDIGEHGISGVTVNLLDTNHQVLQTTTTDGDGFYSFTQLEAGDYVVEFVAPNDFVFSPQGLGSTNDNGSDADPVTGKTHVINLSAHEVDNTIDAGLYESAVDFMFEAEDYEWIDYPWQVYHSSSASGGQFIKAPNGTGSHYNSPPSGKKVMYQFNVDQAGNYEISGLVKASNSSNNSVWVKIDSEPWVQWHMDVTGSSFQWQNVTDGWDQHATAFHLSQGQHTMQLRVREDGTRLDKFMFSKLATTTVVIDAANYDSISGAWEVEVDDDGNEFLLAANGTGSHYSTIPSGNELTYDFSVGQAGTYEMHALVSALNGGDNSFWVAIDDGEWVQWHLTVTNGQWQWQTVTNGFDQTAVTFDLSEGNHTLRIKVREDGTKLDKIVITNDFDLDLDSV